MVSRYTRFRVLLPDKNRWRILNSLFNGRRDRRQSGRRGGSTLFNLELPFLSTLAKRSRPAVATNVRVQLARVLPPDRLD